MQGKVFKHDMYKIHDLQYKLWVAYKVRFYLGKAYKEPFYVHLHHFILIEKTNAFSMYFIFPGIDGCGEKCEIQYQQPKSFTIGQNGKITYSNQMTPLYNAECC